MPARGHSFRFTGDDVPEMSPDFIVGEGMWVHERIVGFFQAVLVEVSRPFGPWKQELIEPVQLGQQKKIFLEAELSFGKHYIIWKNTPDGWPPT